MTYMNVKEFVNNMLDNSGVIFKDNYGRRWKYERYKFYFSDIGEIGFTENKLSCLHLFRKYIYIYTDCACIKS